MTAYLQECDGELNAVITNAIIFEAAEVVPGVELKNRFFTENAAWDTGSEVTIVSSRVIKALGLKPFDHSTIVGIGGEEETDIYKVHLGLRNAKSVNDTRIVVNIFIREKLTFHLRIFT